MEFIDVLNDRGQEIGEKKDKVKVHEDGDWHKVVHVWIVNSKGKLLIQHRSPTMDSYANLWDISCAGHISAGETSMDGVKRELREELSLSLEQDRIEYLFTVVQQAVLNGGKYINNEYCDVFLITEDLDLSQIKLQKSELADAKMIHFKELEEIINAGGKDFVPHPEEYKRFFEILHKRFD